MGSNNLKVLSSMAATTPSKWMLVILNVAFASGLIVVTGLLVWRPMSRLPVSQPEPGRAESLSITAELTDFPSVSLAALPDVSGRWHRKNDTTSIDLHLDRSQIHARVTTSNNAQCHTLLLDAEYTVAEEGLIYGVIQRTTWDTDGLPETVDRGHSVTPMAWIDQPFSVRYRQSGHRITVVDLKFGGSGIWPDSEGLSEWLRSVLGEYESAGLTR